MGLFAIAGGQRLATSCARLFANAATLRVEKYSRIAVLLLKRAKHPNPENGYKVRGKFRFKYSSSIRAQLLAEDADIVSR